MSPNVTTVYRNNNPIIDIQTAKEVANVALQLIDLQKTKTRYAHELSLIRDEYVAIETSQSAKLIDRDRDRAFAARVIELFIAVGQHEFASMAFQHFIDKGPDFTREVAGIILARMNLPAS